MKIGVIGAGAAGLIAIKHAAVDFGVDVIAFELNDRVGGTWVYDEKVGGHSSMYRNLTTNLPIELMCYPNEPFPENAKSFVEAEEVLKYYENFAEKYQLKNFIKFKHEVVRVRPVRGHKWELIAKDLLTGEYETFLFDGILICNGHFNAPAYPDYHENSSYRGRHMHSHDYRYPEIFKDEKILVIGGNFSAVDIAQQTAKFAKSITWSHHLEHQPDLAMFGKNVSDKPDVLMLNENSVTFVDGTEDTFTLIIYCTGYKYSFPFLTVDCNIDITEDFVKPLFKHSLNINRPTMGFVGIANLICPNQYFSLQARFCLTFITGRRQLPSKEEMLCDTNREMNERWTKRQLPKIKAHLMGPNVQDLHYVELAETAGIEPIDPVIPRMHKFTNLNRNRDFINFRKLKYTIVSKDEFTTKTIDV